MSDEKGMISAIQEPGSESMDVRDEPQDGGEVGGAHAEGQEAPAEGEAQEDAALKDPSKLPTAYYGLGLLFQCVACKGQTAITDPNVLRAAFQGASIGLRCPKCGAAQRLIPPEQERPRIVVPGREDNRHVRRAMAAMRGAPRG